MKPTGLHILLTYQCTFECDHCFVWGSPRQSGTLSLKQLREILRQAEAVGSIEWIYFEGGEPFLFYPVLLEAAREVAAAGFRVGIVTNGYWATSLEDALEWLRPFAGLVGDLSVSSDLYHYNEVVSFQMKNATRAAERLGLPVGTISIAQPESPQQTCPDGQSTAALEAVASSESRIMYRGRATEKLAKQVAWRVWTEFGECPHEDLREPGRIHLDPLGNLHVCQGISIGNLFRRTLKEICAHYCPDDHPVVGPLLNGGPVGLVERYALPHGNTYADACHLCYTARLALRERFPETLVPDQMYGII
ncbi:4Fe-4S single cluster domain-containing protein [Desulfotomaculum arcticum]|uniref:4Fe-4S single cluster domain-containing protein n=1 Tax=Desulfotruncus arcticus DSM 17038 TaxID=1121424 RepID=A0A1I2W256_9FIRM|nr:radical SAM protein [Desulfotruncus arcticus]SFG93621.1 4Fe-4S single cluster domain-containing protein [Desulfotomaculum arcticum] [Desulfotruncus arcticus DSM 17038]